MSYRRNLWLKTAVQLKSSFISQHWYLSKYKIYAQVINLQILQKNEQNETKITKKTKRLISLRHNKHFKNIWARRQSLILTEHWLGTC